MGAANAGPALGIRHSSRSRHHEGAGGQGHCTKCHPTCRGDDLGRRVAVILENYYTVMLELENRDQAANLFGSAGWEVPAPGHRSSFQRCRAAPDIQMMITPKQPQA